MGINLSSVYVNCNDFLVFTKKGNANFQTFCSESHEFQALSPGGPAPSLLRSRFLGCHVTLPPKKRLLTSEQHPSHEISQSPLPLHFQERFRAKFAL